MSVLICIIAVVAGWVVLALITTNLVGFIGRGLLQPIVTPELQQLANEDAGGVIAGEVRGMRRADRIVTAIAVVLTVAFLWFLVTVWNVGVALAAVMLMLSRAPDLVWEIQHGRKITAASMPKTPINYLATALSWLALPVIWFAVCR